MKDKVVPNGEMTDKCKAMTNFVYGGKQCSRKAADRGWCWQHAIPVHYILEEELEDAVDGIKCPCEWGDVASAAMSGCEITTALSCTNCYTTTPYMQLTEPKHIKPIVDAWKAACDAKHVSMKYGVAK